MIVSHKHKFIFVKTHKTSTQTFLKFIKPHLGPDDVMAGDGGSDVNEDTKINVDKKFEATGKSALDLQEIYGNHLPWFMIRDTVGQEIWDNYTKFTIERDPYDRLLSLFYFVNPDLCRTKLGAFSSYELIEEINSTNNKDKKRELIDYGKENTWLSHDPEAVRSYFEEWVMSQLLADQPDIMEYKTYGCEAWDQEAFNVKKAAKSNNFNGILKLTDDAKIIESRASAETILFPYSNDKRYLLNNNKFASNDIFRGQCRLLNYGYYYDGNRITVDHIVDFKNVAEGIGKVFNQNNIDITCNKKTYNAATQNAHFRKNLSNKPPNEWWYEGKKSKKLKNIINKKFFKKFSRTSINLNEILGK